MLLFAFDAEGLGKRLVERVGQTVLTCPTTACFDGLPEAPERVAGRRRSCATSATATSRARSSTAGATGAIPVMEGEFLVEESFGVQKAIGGGNFLILAAACRRRRSPRPRPRSTPCARVRGVILPFPGGVVRSGSKVGARRYKKHDRLHQRRVLPDAARAHRRHERAARGRQLGARDRRERPRARRPSTRRCAWACRAACRPGVVEITAGNYGGKLGKHHFQLHALFSGDQLVSVVRLTLRDAPRPCPSRRLRASRRLRRPRQSAEIERLPVWQGREAAQLGDFFDGGGRRRPTTCASCGDVSRVKRLGAGMQGGRLVVEGSARHARRRPR